MSASTDEWVERLNGHARTAKQVFEQMLAAGNAFAPMVLAFRESRTICMAVPGDGDGEVITATARAMASGFNADSIMILSDSYGARTWVNPLTGRRWEFGEMELLAEKHDGLVKGWVHEALILTVITRDSRQMMHQLPYERQAGGRTVKWLDEYRDRKWQELTIGRFITIMQAPVLTSTEALERDLGRKPTRGEMDMVVAKAMIDPEIGRCAEVMLLQSEESNN